MTSSSAAKASATAKNGAEEGGSPLTGLALLRAPFKPHHVSKLPKPTKAQTEAVKADYKKGIRCQQCGSWHHPDVVHLDYVGHAALTDRLLDCDPEWSWEPVAFRDGLPAFDGTGGLWIKLTVCGVTRLGYGHAAAKPGVDPGAREKEVIGDALRNAAMRFGAALDLWHKGDLHVPDPTNDTARDDDDIDFTGTVMPPKPKSQSRETFAALNDGMREAAKGTEADLGAWFKANADDVGSLPHDWKAELREEYGDHLKRCRQRAADPFGLFVDPPEGADPADWMAWLDIVIASIEGAPDAEQVAAAQTVNAEGLTLCMAGIEGVAERIAEASENRLAALAIKDAA